ncbi:hypothetical protein BC351_10480 [Paenibacillus ferrarius]|uniref:Uncharacterized protein n=1 Tax=Paenibacillus ferrarius TaxID=1469647 RepID=A0A1V4H9F0_9BACL|nr:hypothetical protein [Paenibacillus ferrarius]OPH47609.1 hypothetical protein BC351_10480 [Paenibacillus ferrarius]
MEKILNEKKYLHKIIFENYIDPNLFNPIRLLVKYYVVNGLDKRKVYNCVLRYACNIYKKVDKIKNDKVNKRYEEEELEDIVKKNVNYYFQKKKKLIKENKELRLTDIDQIHITKNELYKISMLSNFELERLAYVMLVLSKIGRAKSDNCQDNVNYGVFCNREVFEEAFLSYSYKNKLLINELKQTGHVSPNQENGKSIFVKVLFADKDEDSEVAITITDFRNFAYTYDQFRGSKVITKCKICGITFQKKSKGHKYCEDCQKEKQLEFKRKSINKKRKVM